MQYPYGWLARHFFNTALELQVLQSRAGYYIGTAHPEHGPVSRESDEYWRTQAEARKALASDNWTQRYEP